MNGDLPTIRVALATSDPWVSLPNAIGQQLVFLTLGEVKFGYQDCRAFGVENLHGD